MPEITLKLSGKSGNFILSKLWEPCWHAHCLKATYCYRRRM